MSLFIGISTFADLEYTQEGRTAFGLAFWNCPSSSQGNQACIIIKNPTREHVALHRRCKPAARIRRFGASGNCSNPQACFNSWQNWAWRLLTRCKKGIVLIFAIFITPACFGGDATSTIHGMSLSDPVMLAGIAVIGASALGALRLLRYLCRLGFKLKCGSFPWRL